MRKGQHSSDSGEGEQEAAGPAEAAVSLGQWTEGRGPTVGVKASRLTLENAHFSASNITPFALETMTLSVCLR